jgi:hypothetical protein
MVPVHTQKKFTNQLAESLLAEELPNQVDLDASHFCGCGIRNDSSLQRTVVLD